MRRCLLAAVCLLAIVPQVRAVTRRVAVVVGHNTGSGDRKPLRFAESDAGKFARMLVQVGQVATDDLYLVQGQPIAEVERAVKLVTGRVTEVHRAPDARALVLFYFSGHSDGESLELGPEKLSFKRLKKLLAGTDADVRVVIIDACKSGAAILSKGGRKAPPFTIRLSDELKTSGEVTLASSAADEVALESDEVRGSYFTHHLVSGLRGAADRSGDARVTLTEAYGYAYGRTVRSSTTTLEGPHHPVYDIRLSGQGELVLAYLDQLSSALVLPTELDRALVTSVTRDQVVAELNQASARTIALPPGRYGILVMKADQTYGLRVTLAKGEARRIAMEDLAPRGVGSSPETKGDPGQAPTLTTSAHTREVATEYERRRVWVEDVGMINAATGQYVVTSSLAYRGKYKTPLEGSEFYEAVGRPDLASSYRARSGWKTGLFWGGIVVGLTGSVLGVALIDYGDAERDADLTWLWVGLGITMGGSTLMLISTMIKPHPVAPHEARRLVDEYDRRLREELGYSSVSGESADAGPRIVPFLHGQGGGLAFGFRF